MHEREFDHAQATSDAAVHTTEIAPGHDNRAAQLIAPTRPLASGLLQRKPRDGNGVAEGAEQAVASASSSSGDPLPEPIMRKFESSLATDLSSVRVHTGSESQAAAASVGAHAYTIGHDIHFGAGQYDPSSSAGEHLLAHEVAHTVQQRGGPSVRQHKLAISAPHDAAEAEADRAADAMVRAAPVAGGVSALSHRISRDYRTDLDRAADDGGQEAHDASQSRVLAISTIKDKSEVAWVRNLLDKAQADMPEAIAANDAHDFQRAANNESLNKLDEFDGASKAQDLGISNFQMLYKNVQVAYARLNGMAAKAGSGLTDKNAQGGVSAATGQELAKDHIDNAARSNAGTAALAARVQKLAAMPGNSQLAAKLKAVQQAKEPLDAQVGEVVTSQSQATNAVHKITGAAATLRGLDAGFKSESLRAQFAAAKAKVEEANKNVELVLDTLLTITKTGIEKGPLGVAASYAEKLAPKIATMAAAAAGVPGLTISPADTAKDKEADMQADKQKLDKYTAARNQLQTTAKDAQHTLTAFMNKVALLEQKKREHKAVMDELGTALDDAEARQGKKTKPGETGTFRSITTFLGEADNFLADAKAARDVGQKDLARTSMDSIAQISSAKQSAAESLLVYIPTPWARQPDGGQRRFNVSQQRIRLDFGGKDSAADSGLDAADGGISTIQQACTAIDRFMTEIAAYRDELRAALGV